MKLPTHHTRDTVSMADSNHSTRKMLSPSGSKKKFVSGHATFGVPLQVSMRKAPQGYKVPYVVKKLCTFIEHQGLGYEGIFRVSGSQRVMDKLRVSFDLHGDANLEEDNDMMAVAGLLKLYLRELPEATVPEHMTRRFVLIQEEHQRTASAECIPMFKKLLKELPEEHFDLLKHIIRFLAIVSCNESENRMSPMALAIVFGPNLFRCGKGFLALKDQGTTNQIVYRFIMDYNVLFKDPKEDPPAVYFERKQNNVVPPRPPPPQFLIEEPEVTMDTVTMETSTRPVPSPRKSKMKTYEGNPTVHIEAEDQDHSESSISSRGRNSHSYNSPNFSDDEMTGRLSPFHLDSESGFSLAESPVPSARTSAFVDKAIKATVIGHLFGDESSLLNASIDTTIRDDHTEIGSERGALHIDSNSDLDSTQTEDNLAVKDRAKRFEPSQSGQTEGQNKPTKQRPTSKAFQMFENKGIIITQMHGMNAPSHQHIDDTETGEDEEATGEGFEGIRRDSDPLQNFKKPAGPQNRRNPTRRLLHNTADGNTEETMEDQDIETVDVIPNGHVPIDHSNSPLMDGFMNTRTDGGDINHNDSKSRMAFLDIHRDNNHLRNSGSPDKSPTSGAAKSFVPPLDFTTLHENVGSQDAILAQKAQTASYQRVTPELGVQHNDEDNENDDPSPKSHKVKRKAGTAMEEDDDLPPFSQVDQDQYKLHSHGSTDDELTTKMKSQMRKIQGLKKKVKQFEEAFERENGYKPSHAEKASKPEIKKSLVELSRARKEAKRLKEEAEMGSRSRHGSGTSSTGERVEPPDLPPSMGGTLDIILKRLKDKRKDSFRPEDIELMNADQVQDEKLAVQKALLHFEGLHGRPKTRDEKDLMRPLYDRYRTIKRLLSRQPMSPRGNLELQTVPEDQPMDILTQAKFADEPVKAEPIRVPTAFMENNINNEDDDEDHVAPLGTVDFAVTRDFSILKSRPITVENQGPHSPKARRKLELRENIENRNLSDSNLHELSAPELHDQLIKSRNLKKKLRKTLRDFEENFTTQTGRKVGRDDRIPMQPEYNEYKQLKARLKLLEALLSKHNHSEV